MSAKRSPSELGISERSIKELETVLSTFFSGRGSARVFVFGSRARGDGHMNSDLDLLIVSAIPDLKRHLGNLSETLEESTLPFKVDLVCEPDVYEAYRPQIDREKKLLFSF